MGSVCAIMGVSKLDTDDTGNVCIKCSINILSDATRSKEQSFKYFEIHSTC